MDLGVLEVAKSGALAATPFAMVLKVNLKGELGRTTGRTRVPHTSHGFREGQGQMVTGIRGQAPQPTQKCSHVFSSPWKLFGCEHRCPTKQADGF